MYSDTHFHFRHICDDGVDGVEVLSALAARDTFFGLDIGTRCDDLADRKAFVEKTIDKMPDSKLADKARKFMYYSAGIWPDVQAIHDRENQIKTLRSSISTSGNIIAVGECGIDHHWNPAGVDGRNESDFDEKTYRGERELFEAQLELARELSLPVIVHSRDGFEDTLDCLKNVGYDNGIIHCYSYGIDEARAFLDRGWYIAFGGGVTYTKKSKLDEMNALLNFVPSDRFLCETDAPYLAPVPFRGTVNTPVLVEHTYDYIAAARKITSEQLSAQVDDNIKVLFKI